MQPAYEFPMLWAYYLVLVGPIAVIAGILLLPISLCRFSRTRTVRRVAGVLAGCLVLAGCGGPGDRRARGDFVADYPGLRIVDCVAAEGNSDAVWYNFHFTDKVTGKPGEMQVLYNWDPALGKWTHGKIADRILPQ